MLEVVKKIVSVTVALGDNAAKMLFLFFQRLTFTMASFCASCQRHEISITPYKRHEVERSVGYAAGARGCVPEAHYYHHRWTTSTVTHIVACLWHASIRG